MSDPRVMRLLEEILESGRAPEEACADTPELLSEVREGLRRCRHVDAEVDAMFPPSRRKRGPEGRTPAGRGGELPRIPGYEVEAVLGRGGMGIVYRARHLRLNREVALKMILAGPYARASELARFGREAEAVASLRHPHIVQVYDVGDLEGLPYFTMEYVEGGSLGQKLGGTPQPADEAAALMEALAGAVQAAHEAGIVHRDLKPGNVLLTADGSPKVMDFGLARHVGEERGITLSGTGVGTPSYMAPEQATGGDGAAGPGADIYSLGAMLYEMLTGRPPFRAETALETERQLLTQEPVPPSRLNARVPRDLETICLKCLRKEPERRYATAAGLAADLKRLREGRPIEARPPGWGGRLWRWGKREPAAAAFVVTAVALVGLAVGGGFWIQRQRADARAALALREGRTLEAVEAGLAQAAGLQEKGRWSEARAALEGVPSLENDASAPAELRERLRRARADARMVTALEEVRLRLAEGERVTGRESAVADRLYREAFREYGIDVDALAPGDAVTRVRGSAIRETLVEFLHDWFYWVPKGQQAGVRAVVDGADDDPWRRKYRQALVETDVARLKELAHAPERAGQPPAILSGLGGTLLVFNERETAWALLRDAQERHPADFWMNYLLGNFLEDERPQEAVGYLRAAVAIRPASDQAYTLLGRGLRNAGNEAGAILAFRQAFELDPTHAGARDLATILARKGRLAEMRESWAKILERNPPNFESWYGYAQLCLYLGDEPAYRRARKALLDRFGDRFGDWTIAERTSLAGLLLPSGDDDLRRAVALADRAVAVATPVVGADNPYVEFLKGLSEYRQGHLEVAVELLGNAAVKLPNRAGPGLVLAMAQFRSGATDRAGGTLAVAVRAYNWQAAVADHPTVWVSHVLRREAEALILPELPAFFRGAHRPADNDERLVLMGACESRGLYLAAARLCADAFEVDAGLAGELTEDCLSRAAGEREAVDRVEALCSECRYRAARCAALAGCGIGEEAAGTSGAERARWRERARAWLRADLAAWATTRASGADAERDCATTMLSQWQTEPDLSGVRGPDALRKLPAEEQEAWASLWANVRRTLLE